MPLLSTRKQTGQNKSIYHQIKVQAIPPLAKVYLVACRFDVKLQADNPVRWDVAERLNRKQKHKSD
jgi:hypothetical protein